MTGGIITHQANQGGQAGSTYKRFPLWMKHPHEQAAEICDERVVDGNGKERWVNKPPGKAIKFGPCQALDAQQEEYFRAQGYLPIGEPDQGAYDRATIAAPPPGYQHHEFPKMLPDGTIDLGPDAPPPPSNFYPYYLRMEGYEPTLVQDLDEHQELLRERQTSLPQRQAEDVEREMEELEAKLAALREKRAAIGAERPETVKPDDAATEKAAAGPAEAPGEVDPITERPAEADLQAPERLAEEVLEQQGAPRHDNRGKRR
jgi:hypothetical protein